MKTSAMSDAEFLASFESLEIPGSAFRHGDHVRLHGFISTIRTSPPVPPDSASNLADMFSISVRSQNTMRRSHGFTL